MRVLSLGFALGLACVAGCSSSSTGTGNGNAGGSGSDCSINMPLSGAVSASFGDQPACGNGGTSTVFWSTNPLVASGPQVNASIDFATALAGGQTGAVTVSDVTITERADGGSLVWMTPPGACTVNVTSNVSNPDSSGIFRNRYTIKGSGSCTQPAAADGTSGAQGTVTIGAFTFTGFIDPGS